MQHGLIFDFDGRRVREDQDFGDELPMDFGAGGIVEFGENDHSLSDFFSSNAFERKRGGLACRADRHGDPFAFDATDGGCGELPKGVWTDEDSVSGMDDAGLYDAGDDGADEGDGESVVDVEFERSIGVIVPVVGEHVEEHTNEVEGFAGDVADLEDGADALGDELRSGDDCFVAVSDEYGDFASSGRFKDAGKLGDGLLEDVGWADVNFGDDDHDGDVEC